MEIGIKGRFLKAKKAFFEGTHRLCSPEETFEKILKENERIGLTRVADITGFDCLGIPVTAAIRPNSMTLSSSSGKGLTKISAIVSGIMEAMELYQAETQTFETEIATCEEIRDRAVSLHQLSCRKHAIFPKNWPYQWCFGWDLIKQKEIAAPLMAVSMDRRSSQQNPFDLDSFEVTSNGLASGNHPLEAIVSGLYEVIERDGITCMGSTAPKIRLNTIASPVVKELVELLKRKDVGIALYDSRVDTGIYIFKAHLCDCKFGFTAGYGAHLDPEVAMVRALTEAIQARAVYASGSRDDLFQSVFQHFLKFNTERTRVFLDSVEETVDASGFQSEATDSFEGDIHLLLAKLKKIDVEHVVVFDLSAEESCVNVFKVIVPGLEGYHSATYQPGKRKAGALREESLHLPAGGMP